MTDEEQWEQFSKKWNALIESVNDERTFLHFLKALQESCATSERECSSRPHNCILQGHWEAHSTKDFLRSAEDWGSRGDFGEGVHHGEPILRRVATMLFASRFRVREDPPDDRYD